MSNDYTTTGISTVFDPAVPGLEKQKQAEPLFDVIFEDDYNTFLSSTDGTEKTEANDPEDQKKQSWKTATTGSEDLGVKKYCSPHDEEEVYNFPEDIYSFIFLFSCLSRPFVYALVVFAIQIAVLILTLFYLLKGYNNPSYDGNPLKIPINVPLEVSISQVLAIIMAVAYSDDITVAIHSTQVGYRSELLPNFPSATNGKYQFSIFARSIMGLTLLSVSFLIVIQNNNALEIFYNFAAIHFVGELDGRAFELARLGFLGPFVRAESRKMQSLAVVSEKTESKNLRYFVQIGIMITLFAAMFTGWLDVFLKQKNGTYLRAAGCANVRVAFGDEIYNLPPNTNITTALEKSSNEGFLVFDTFDKSSAPDIHYAYFSGIYIVNQDSDLVNARLTYHEQGFNDDDKAGYFYYCVDIKSWVFTIKAFSDAKGDSDKYVIPMETKTKGCNDGWLMKSPETNSFLLEEVQTDGWEVWTGKIENVESLSFKCVECTEDIDCGINHGTCSDGICSCKTGYQGTMCNEETACEYLMYRDTDDESDTLYKMYRLGGIDRAISFHERPIYFFYSESDNDYEIILYSGRRWYDAYFTAEEFDQFNARAVEVFNKGIEVRSNTESLTQSDVWIQLHMYWGNILLDKTQWFTDPTKSFTAEGPLTWYKRSKYKSIGNFGPFGSTSPTENRFDCAYFSCDIPNMCGTNGYCSHYNMTELLPDNETYVNLPTYNDDGTIKSDYYNATQCSCSTNEFYDENTTGSYYVNVTGVYCESEVTFSME